MRLSGRPIPSPSPPTTDGRARSGPCARPGPLAGRRLGRSVPVQVGTDRKVTVGGRLDLPGDQESLPPMLWLVTGCWDCNVAPRPARGRGAPAVLGGTGAAARRPQRRCCAGSVPSKAAPLCVARLCACFQRGPEAQARCAPSVRPLRVSPARRACLWRFFAPGDKPSLSLAVQLRGPRAWLCPAPGKSARPHAERC